MDINHPQKFLSHFMLDHYTMTYQEAFERLALLTALYDRCWRNHRNHAMGAFLTRIIRAILNLTSTVASKLLADNSSLLWSLCIKHIKHLLIYIIGSQYALLYK